MLGSGVKVISSDLKKHPQCPHGPTILFARNHHDAEKRFFACSACRNRKQCNFFLWEKDLKKFKKDLWEKETRNLIDGINHVNSYKLFNQTLSLTPNERFYCHDCEEFQLGENKLKHNDHKHTRNVSDYQMKCPSEFLRPLEEDKKEAQYLFTKNTVNTIVDMLKKLNLKNVLCIGAPRIHEHVKNSAPDMNSFLLDIDKRFLSFFGPSEFCWYNAFNNHFFLNEQFVHFKEFLQINNGEELILITDPPFGGRVELLSTTFKLISEYHKELNEIEKDLPIFWIFPYFNESHILNNLSNFTMLDYKVDYDNHPLFSDGPKGRKQGSPVRIFTNLDPCLIELPEEEGYKLCKKCNRWVSKENKHCNKCKVCTSKDGRTYVHCDACKKCVKPTWTHCDKCNRCAQIDHKCGETNNDCFHCKLPGHKKRECPSVDHELLKRKRKRQKL